MIFLPQTTSKPLNARQTHEWENQRVKTKEMYLGNAARNWLKAQSTMTHNETATFFRAFLGMTQIRPENFSIQQISQGKTRNEKNIPTKETKQWPDRASETVNGSLSW